MSVQKLIPYIEYQLVEYGSIFPDVNSILDHLFYVIGNGYHWHEERSVPVHAEYTYFRNGKNKSKFTCIDEFPVNTPSAWKKIIAKVRVKKQGYFEQNRAMYEDLYADRPEQLTEYYARHQRDLESIVPVTVFKDRFTARSLMDDISLDENRNHISFRRPYLISQYSAINYIDEESPKWLVRIALASIRAWHTYLVNELDLGNTDESERGVKNHWSELETKKIITTFQELYKKLSEFNVPGIGDTVRIARDDPNWQYCGCARPKIGTYGVVVPIESMYAGETAGKTAVAFKETALGYEESDKGDITLFLPTFQLEVV